MKPDYDGIEIHRLSDNLVRFSESGVPLPLEFRTESAALRHIELLAAYRLPAAEIKRVVARHSHTTNPGGN